MITPADLVPVAQLLLGAEPEAIEAYVKGILKDGSDPLLRKTPASL